ncbi:MAG: TIGR03960 family B12-binding radical SAM protein [Candidatus Marinimicrobia bacterium]|nr:TIGR03960 family B12-binding radical SAM protein [Candidatus Neomarinimicrobiota bacterium]
MKPIENWNKVFNIILPKVEKPGRYVGQERNTIIKDLEKVDATIVLAFPDLYDIGMSYYGFQILYHVLNKDKKIATERVYAPWPDFETELRKNKIPLYSLESHVSLKNFDVVGFSFSYELGYTNMLNMLDMAKISIFSKERQEDEPLVIAGGGSVFNAEPITAFVDCILPGDGEEIALELMHFIGVLKKKPLDRKQKIEAIARKFDRIYVPAFYDYDDTTGKVFPLVDFVPQRIKTSKLTKLSNDIYPENPLIPLLDIAQDRYVAEIMRGCTRGCRFCQAGMIYRPVRERKPEDIVRQVKSSFSNTGYDEVSLLSLSTSDYNGLEKAVCGILDSTKKNSMSLSFPSMRLDTFTEKVAEYAKQAKKSGLTFAPEAGSQGLRDIINKQISEKELMDSVKIAIDNGWQLVKLYFMIGLPGETMEDVMAIADLVEKVLKIGGKKLNVNVTLSSFIPKVFTPFQWEAQDLPECIQQKIDSIKPVLRAMKRVKVMSRDPRYSQLEGLMSRGDRKLAQVIYKAWQRGAKFDGWREYYNFDLWEEMMLECGLNLQDYTGERNIDSDLPWEIIDPGITRTFLLKEKNAARKAALTPDCREGCINCGVCFDDLQMDLVDSDTENSFSFSAEPSEPSDNKHRYRLNFVKTGAAKFTSHLDIIRIFKQALKGARLDVCYTGGYNKKPKISAGYPLPYSFTSNDEYIEIFLEKPVENLDKLLNTNLPDGLKVKKYKKINLRTASVSNLVTGFDYQVNFLEKLPENIKSEVEEVLKQKNIWINRTRKNQIKKLDIREFIDTIEVHNDTIDISIIVKDGKTVKIQEVLHLLNIQEQEYYVHRQKTAFKAEFFQEQDTTAVKN